MWGMSVPVTRRRLALLAATPLLEAEAPAQQPAASAPTDDLAIQRENLNRWRTRLNEVRLPRAVEPVVTFKA